jgi:radical SAM superfamily enzyme with C-terminal helix-hairpin-helix motif
MANAKQLRVATLPNATCCPVSGDRIAKDRQTVKAEIRGHTLNGVRDCLDEAETRAIGVAANDPRERQERSGKTGSQSATQIPPPVLVTSLAVWLMLIVRQTIALWVHLATGQQPGRRRGGLMGRVAAIVDCYTVEPSGLGVPPYLSAYARQAFSTLTRAYPGSDVRYLTIDDVRWCGNGGRPFVPAPLSDQLTYSATVNRDEAFKILTDADPVVVIAGDTVPSVHLHARNGSPEEIDGVLGLKRGRGVLVGPLASQLRAGSALLGGRFDAMHTHTVTSSDLLAGSTHAAAYGCLAADRDSYAGLIAQLGWRPVAEIELYRGCTRRQFCSFCNEPVKSRLVSFRDPTDVLAEIALLYAAGVRNFRLGQQTCFFSYLNRDTEAIGRLLAGIRDECPDLEVLHIDNADPLAVASRSGAKTAALVARYCTEGNCAPMGIESFDPAVIEANSLTCSPEILVRAVANINEAGAQAGSGGLPMLLPGLNLVYGMPGETHRSHYENLSWLVRILDAGYRCHRVNVRQVHAYPGTALSARQLGLLPPSSEHFAAWKADVSYIFDQPMKQRVYPAGMTITRLHSFFVTTRGTWHRRLGSYSIQVVETGTARALYEETDLMVTGHEPRYLYGTPPDRVRAAA